MDSGGTSFIACLTLALTVGLVDEALHGSKAPSSGSVTEPSANQVSFPEEAVILPKATQPEQQHLLSISLDQETWLAEGLGTAKGLGFESSQAHDIQDGRGLGGHPAHLPSPRQGDWPVQTSATYPHLQFLLPEVAQGTYLLV